MLMYLKRFNFLLFCFFFVSFSLFGDSFKFNTYNNHGVLGLINMPTARFYNEGSAGITLYDGTPDQKITLTTSPYDWLEASLFYSNLQGVPYPFFEYQDYKDKGFNFKVRLKEEGVFPAIAIGINDIAGTGYFSSEYIVASYGIGNLDLHFGLGWGTLNGSKNGIKNPLIYVNKSFQDRPIRFKGAGGQFQSSRYFSDLQSSPFFGASYAINKNILIKIENDTTKTDSLIDYKEASSQFSYGLEYNINKNFNIGISIERGNYYSLKFSYKKDISSSAKPYQYNNVEKDKEDNKYSLLIKNLESNGIGVNKITETAKSIGIELTQFSHPNLDVLEEILYTAKMRSGIDKGIEADFRIANLQAYEGINKNTTDETKLIYKKKSNTQFNSSTKLNIRPYLAAREGFLKAAILLENNSEYILKDNLFFSANLKYSIKDNFGDLTIPPQDTYPEQVRSDVKDYLRNFENRVIIGRAQLDYYYSLNKNNHLMITAGILEEMFNGYGFEYLFFDSSNDYGIGLEVFNVQKRDYKSRFGQLEYNNTSGFISFYYRNSNLITFDTKISHGKYLAGDIGTTFEISRSYRNGAKFGVFASFTDVTQEQFGEGSFDKGIFFNIPIYKNFVNYSWRPLTKDPGARLLRKNTLHDLLVKFKPYSD